MPDINPAELSRPSIGLATPVLSTKTITVSAPTLQKSKGSQLVPARIDVEPIYTALKAAIGSEQWAAYKEATTQFLIGRLNQAEFSERIDPIITSQNGEKEHLHNQLIAAIYGNVTREMPDQGLAPWVSANDKPTTASGSKPISGDAAERRLKGEVMQLPSRDRRRIKDLAHNDVDPYESLANVFTDHHKARPPRATAEIPPSAGGLNRMNFDLEIRKRYAQPLAVESGEFPDVSNIEARMLPSCYEAGLVSGHAPDAAHYMSVATECFIKEVLAGIFSRTRSNGPGESGSAGFGTGTSWIQTHKYKRQLVQEEGAALRGDVTRDKGGLLPVEAKSAGERGPLGMADLRLALDMSDCGMSQFPIIAKSIIYNYRDGELENWDDYTWLDGQGGAVWKESGVEVNGVNGTQGETLPNGVSHDDHMDIDDEMWWEGADNQDVDGLDGILDSCLAVG
ncbi:Transcriptional coactivator HFI1/ADA1 [Pleurostoma richardsiae]|uniref:Transcriptional coactivator HFI1/ADA1 n=1 Tax=Pleurostoma richardsiae TaxID=41990 RepID=A0AA38S0A0_9PEZI|nr:Transcriptional coactivator HFI1/ADA1 [Pleurostoma richardsiae]